MTLIAVSIAAFNNLTSHNVSESRSPAGGWSSASKHNSIKSEIGEFLEYLEYLNHILFIHLH